MHHHSMIFPGPLINPTLVPALMYTVLLLMTRTSQMACFLRADVDSAQEACL